MFYQDHLFNMDYFLCVIQKQIENEIKIHVNNLCTVKRKLLMPNTITKNLSGYEIFMQIWINTLKHTTKYLL